MQIYTFEDVRFRILSSKGRIDGYCINVNFYWGSVKQHIDEQWADG
jgi:hypothetical protein